MRSPDDDALERALGEPIEEVELIARSSNLVYRVTTSGGGRYTLRIPHLRELSAFWCQLRDVFGLEYASKFDRSEQVVAAIRSAGLHAPELVARVDGGYLFTWIDGDTWEPDTFPDRDDVHEQLGRFLGAMHAHARDGDARVHVDRTNASMSRVIAKHWSEHDDVRRAFEELSRVEPTRVAGGFALIMPDISGNQFVYNADGIAGVVDIDSYVIGPRELELTIAEWCVTRPDAFRRGYEEHEPLPRFAGFRRYHRFMMVLNEPGTDLEHALQENVHFP